MSISSIGGYVNPAMFGTQQTSSASATSTAAVASTPASSGSDWLTLSPDAQAVASLNAAGVTVECVPLSDVPNLASGQSSAATTSTGQGDLSESEFEKALAGYGASSSQADQYFADIDSNDNGSVSNSELITALGDTGSDTDSSLSQGLLSLMNTSHSGVVSGSEFTAFETSLVTAETPNA